MDTGDSVSHMGDQPCVFMANERVDGVILDERALACSTHSMVLMPNRIKELPKDA